MRNPPQPIPDALMGITSRFSEAARWRFASLPAGDLVDAFRDRPIPFFKLPDELQPFQFGLASTLPIPGVVIDGGRRSRQLAQWLQEVDPISLNYSAGAPDGLILEAGVRDRWIINTFDDPEVRRAAQQYEQRKHASQGLHFLLIQPDDSGMTYTGFWLLQRLDPANAVE
ncbi:Tab2 family RNA-binding protein [Myxacorys almedinensis]|uniref:DUF1092 family protein n=1 Tax=Myxacorys almedinensis A TaxID=2690445 RepID=A0A8J8CNX8_9CYAN|nr:Tab2 family RNA-binding protein [Myxacorys almedinensis]NDJ18902.1 DUF1092 family protein [Myxacorys almedinensis A]